MDCNIRLQNKGWRHFSLLHFNERSSENQLKRTKLRQRYTISILPCLSLTRYLTPQHVWHMFTVHPSVRSPRWPSSFTVVKQAKTDKKWSCCEKWQQRGWLLSYPVLQAAASQMRCWWVCVALLSQPPLKSLEVNSGGLSDHSQLSAKHAFIAKAPVEMHLPSRPALCSHQHLWDTKKGVTRGGGHLHSKW
jgi:hypothetical protein